MDFQTLVDVPVSQCSRSPFDVHFRYFSTEETRRTSVKQIQSDELFNPLGEALDDGLHSPALGPLDHKLERNRGCPTCGLDSRQCPGHMGHIELACTIYNPFLMSTLLELLKRTCLKCYRFKAAESFSRAILDQLTVLSRGELTDILARPAGSRAPWVAGRDCNNDEEAWLHWIEDHTAGAMGKETYDPRTSNSHSALGEAIAERCVAAAERALFEAHGASGAEGEEVPQHQVPAEHTSFMEAYRMVCKIFMKGVKSQCQHENCKEKSNKLTRFGFQTILVHSSREPDGVGLLAERARSILKALWKNEHKLLWMLLPGLREAGPDVFFMDVVMVPPNRFRPATPGDGPGSGYALSTQTEQLRTIMEANAGVKEAFKEFKGNEKSEKAEIQKAEKADKAEKPNDRRFAAMRVLQDAVNSFLDSSKGVKLQKLAADGTRQLLEKKQGLFRMKMMGKRVNFAARSVISPDVNLETNQIGIPLLIAKRLSFPEVACQGNAEDLGRLIMRGQKYPGANEVHEQLKNGAKKIWNLKGAPMEKRRELAGRLVSILEEGLPPMIVMRQLRDDDPLLVNRQPTLHKPGIMAHLAKVLAHEKTIRLHYANCNTYNADFDGDEMNLHAPQDPVSRLEALNIARADRQFLVPTSGKPLRGLIQDHVISGVMLTKRDTFFTRADVCMFLFTALSKALIKKAGFIADATRRLKRDEANHRLKLDPPCILRPVQLWSGKQVFSMLLKIVLDLHMEKAQDHGGLCLQSKSKTPGDIWNGKMDGNKEESTVCVQATELLQGVMDKEHFGATSFSLTHLTFELAGPAATSVLLSALSRLFSSLLQVFGFTCAFRDLLLKDEADAERRRTIKEKRERGIETISKWLVENDESVMPTDTFEDLCRTGRRLLESNFRLAETLEQKMLGSNEKMKGDVIGVCIPKGQRYAFPKNCFSAMVNTGAKGGKVNHSQVSCLLGQQELEGRQVPLMTGTRRSLPCFAAYDLAPRTRGLITDRFLTGIRPQEFFFHCMAGREGLIDTAVKTSRSGYLQRCLVKHLECLKVGYDMTVRDADGTVVQFRYGEDGVDVTRSPHLVRFEELHRNFKFIKARSRAVIARLSKMSSDAMNSEVGPAYLRVQRALRGQNHGDMKRAIKDIELLEASNAVDATTKQSLREVGGMLRALLGGNRATPSASSSSVPSPPGAEDMDPVGSALNPLRHFGATSERHQAQLQKFLGDAAKSGLCTGEDASMFERCMNLKFMRSLAEPGEAVGVIAAQSMGEPSTQMTLNTFHLAGHGGANVTLGIPRLREIIQTTSTNMATPTMKIRVAGATREERRLQAHQLSLRFRRVTLMDCLRSVVTKELVHFRDGKVCQTISCTLTFWPLQELCAEIPHLSREGLQDFVQTKYCNKIKAEMQRVLRATQKGGGVRLGKKQKVVTEEGDVDDDAAGAGPAHPKRRKHEGAEEEIQEEAEGADEQEEAGDDDDDVSGGYEDPDPDVMEDAKLGSKVKAEDEDEESQEDAPEDAEEEANMESDDEPKMGAKVKEEVEDDVGAGDAEEERENEEEDQGKAKKPGKATKEQKVKKEAKVKEETQVKEEDNDDGFGTVMESPSKRPRREVDEEWRKAEDLLTKIEGSKSPITAGSMTKDGKITVMIHLDLAQTSGHTLLLSEMLTDTLSKVRLQSKDAEGISRVLIEEDETSGKTTLTFEGTNLAALHHLPEEMVDHKSISTNDLQAVLRTYGVEACRESITREIRGVFGHYGIDVNHRHLSLIADFMTQGGTIRAFNRGGMINSMSPFLQMSYETTMEFLSMACKDRLPDTIQSPASAITVGQPPPLGTGAVNLYIDLSPIQPKDSDPAEQEEAARMALKTTPGLLKGFRQNLFEKPSAASSSRLGPS